MASILVLTHAHDRFRACDYILRRFVRSWLDSGHRVAVARGLGDWPEADIAILHVDLSVVPETYVQATARYPIVLNGAATDIRKRAVSRQLLQRGEPWDGPVIVKTDLNCGGQSEVRTHQRALLDGSSEGRLTNDLSVLAGAEYPVLASVDEVPDAVWNNRDLVVERFLPEQDAQGYWMRTWLFFGDQDRCSRHLGRDPVLKSSGILASEPSAVPDALRAERQRLGFDYGKFDFVVHDGRAILLDANKTPWMPTGAPPEFEAALPDLARGIEACIGDRAMS
ncbi:hypothetical protein [Arenimonas sp.]|uniref:hypothetical protein n=1 Tax=Arenimonas sp. TaxID=1872635 RepID=UPI0039E28C2D